MSNHEKEINSTLTEGVSDLLELPEAKPKAKSKAKPKAKAVEVMVSGSGYEAPTFTTQITDTISQANAKVNRFLPEPIREEMIARLIEWGYDKAASYDDQALIDTQNRYISQTRDQLVEKKTNELKDKLTMYAEGTELTNIELIDRLYHLNVHKKYLRLFRDRDHDLTNDQIWEIIRYSPIPAVEGGVKEIFKERYSAQSPVGIDPVEHQFRYGIRR